MNKISVIVKQPGQDPYHTHIPNTLEDLQKIVGGYIETFTVATDFVLICNEEGRLRGLPYNFSFGTIDLVGPVIFAGVKEDEFADIPMSFEDFHHTFAGLFKRKDGADNDR